MCDNRQQTRQQHPAVRFISSCHMKNEKAATLPLILLAESPAVPAFQLSTSRPLRKGSSLSSHSAINFGHNQEAHGTVHYVTTPIGMGARGPWNNSFIYGTRLNTYQTPWECCEPQSQLDVKCWGLLLSGMWVWHQWEALWLVDQTHTQPWKTNQMVGKHVFWKWNVTDCLKTTSLALQKKQLNQKNTQYLVSLLNHQLELVII